MSSPWFTCLIIDQLFCITMIRTDKHLSVNFLQCFYSFTYAFIYSLNSLDCSSFHTCMSNHIRICKIDHDHIIFISFDGLNQFFAYLRSAHLRLKIIGCNLRRFHKDSVFTFVWLFYTTVKEEGYMGIFLCLSNTGLGHIMCCQIFSKCVLQLNLMESYQLVLDGIIIICKAYKSYMRSCFSLKAFKLIITECSCDLTGTVRTEIKEHY